MGHRYDHLHWFLAFLPRFVCVSFDLGLMRREEELQTHNQGSAAKADESAETAKWVFISYSHAKSNPHLFFFPRWIYFWISFVVILSGEGGGEIEWRALHPLTTTAG